MSSFKLIVVSTCAVAAAAVTLATMQARASGGAREELRVAMRRRDALRAEIAIWETKVRDAERRAVAAERDTAELLAAVKSLRERPVSLTTMSADARSRPSERTGATAEVLSADEMRAQYVAAAASVDETRAAQAQAAAGLALNAEEQARRAPERAYQQALAKKRAEEAKEKAAFEDAAREFDAATKFNALIQRAREQAERSEYAFAVRTFNEAMSAKPADLPVPPEARELQAMLQAQSKPVAVTLISDGETFVSITNTRAPMRFTSNVVRLLPGDYQVVGRRRGYRDVVMLLQVRTGVPLPTVSVVCTQTAER